MVRKQLKNVLKKKERGSTKIKARFQDAAVTSRPEGGSAQIPSTASTGHEARDSTVIEDHQSHQQMQYQEGQLPMVSNYLNYNYYPHYSYPPNAFYGYYEHAYPQLASTLTKEYLLNSSHHLLIPIWIQVFLNSLYHCILQAVIATFLFLD